MLPAARPGLPRSTPGRPRVADSQAPAHCCHQARSWIASCQGPAAAGGSSRYSSGVTDTPRARVVYSTERGPTCPRCGWPERDCRCSSRAEQAVPQRVVAHLRIEKKGRGGKTVTVIDNLPRNAAFVRALAAELKRACGAGGTAGDASVEVQGDHREVLRRLFAAKGWTVKG
jgi:translation initiation factor 1